MADRFERHGPGITDPAYNAFSITPSDTVNFSKVTRAIYVGGAGNVVGILSSGDQVTFNSMSAGNIYPLRLKRVNSTSTTATNLVGLY